MRSRDILAVTKDNAAFSLKNLITEVSLKHHETSYVATLNLLRNKEVGALSESIA